MKQIYCCRCWVWTLWTKRSLGEFVFLKNNTCWYSHFCWNMSNADLESKIKQKRTLENLLERQYWSYCQLRDMFFLVTLKKTLGRIGGVMSCIWTKKKETLLSVKPSELIRSEIFACSQYFFLKKKMNILSGFTHRYKINKNELIQKKMIN